MGCDLSSDQTEVTFNKNAKRKAGATYTENRADPLKRSTTHKTRDESILWGTTTDFCNDPIPPYQSFEIVLTDAAQHIAFLRLLKQQLSFETTYTYFPKVEKTVSKGKFWVSRFEDHQPRHPIFIVSKGRAYSRVTAMALQRMGVPFRIIIEPQDWDDYEAFFDPSQLIVAPFQFLRRDTEKPSYIASLGSLLKQVDDTRAEVQIDLIEVYESIREWSKARNATIHQFVKVTDRNQQSNGDDRIRQAQAAARDGMRLMRKISALVRKHNKWRG